MSDWIAWEGGERPVHPETRIEYKMRESGKSSWDAGSVRWRHTGDPDDIVAYRVLENATAKEKVAFNILNENDKESYLEEANRITGLDRNKAYGHPLDNHTLTAAYWSGWINRKYGTNLELCAEDVCWLNSLQKHSREANMQKRDNAVDVIGYLRNVEMITEERERRKLEGM